MPLRVLTWNLLHGRAVPPAGRDLRGDFASALAGWEWDVALLQEVPPWWPPWLATTLRARARLVLTSRNGLLPVRQAVAIRWPDLIKSNGGGANAILVRDHEIAQHRTLRLCRRPERRWLQAVRLADGPWVGNLHATVHDAAGALRDGRLAAGTTLAWAAGAPAVLGGDFNLRVRELALDGFTYAGGYDVDHVFTTSGLSATGNAEVLDRGPLSDHAPVAIELEVVDRSEERPARR
ncbi:MAG: endonuclease/exonuclease/phosphatase family protein [Actinomycetota bacterium]|nr:endonuclease/exonuclease/phosphatase family protein [Actinomycetota bacterium]